MTEAIKTGGLAFPFNDIGGDCDPGMTLRDYFAAKAMAALIPRYADVNIDDLEVLEEIAIRASNMADAMIKARG
ncbi:hypothetical protein CH54_3778 [Yersinia rochesterensis]|uniref:Uncharacterized protein n=1 Tax=Yersinia rochesterensis TaxID=1604335 RepID=A0ABM5SN27_9GAMM|nr:hypothetical protein [Yersinia rochesterensis]AJI87781.1 hypothetical protein AW19_2007 [Yersinia frederiksenii Y225]AJJ35954.1 hypothetical protein CH54_3778 [Yersinia rochesterensis]